MILLFDEARGDVGVYNDPINYSSFTIQLPGIFLETLKPHEKIARLEIITVKNHPKSISANDGTPTKAPTAGTLKSWKFTSNDVPLLFGRSIF